MKKILSLTLLSIIVATITIPTIFLGSSEATYTAMGTPYVDKDFQQTIDEYFNLRKTLLLPDNQVPQAFVTNKLAGFLDSPNVASKIEERLSAVDNLALYHDVHVLDTANSATVTDITQSGASTYKAKVYEWTWIEYNDGQGSATDIMGFATDHEMVLQKDDAAGYKILDDIYDDSDILGVPSHYNDSLVSSTQGNESVSIKSNGINSNVDLNVNNLIDYADKWVVHEYSKDAMMNPSNYNKSVYGYYSADCANFVSQCLDAGGMQYDYGDGKHNGNWDGTQWWFDLRPNPSYENYNVSPPSWRLVSKFIEYWKNQGYSQVSATASTVFPGNPVMNNTSHVGICVGYNSSGTPIINAHNRDVYHVPYTMIGSGTKTTIQILTKNKMQYDPSDATTITPSTTSQSMVKYMNPGSNHYYTFTVSSSGYYTFETAYYASSQLDTKATLYKPSRTSNGTLLYMDEIASNDDGGDDFNCRLREYLTPGTYYIRVRAIGLSETGYYYFFYKKG